MPIDWKPFVELVNKHHNFLLTTHVRPDADGLGSKLALADTLQRMGKTVQMVIASVMPPRYYFMDLQQRIQRFQPPGEEFDQAEVIVVLDTGTWKQLGNFGDYIKGSQAQKVVIDHHQSQEDLGGLALVDTSAEATGRLVYELITALEQPISEPAANFLFSALATDTGWFRHSNTTADTFGLALTLMNAGAQPTALYEHLYEQNSLPRLMLTGLVLQRIRVLDDGLIAYTEVKREDYKKTGAVPQDTEDLINFCRSLIGVEVAMMFMEQPEGGVKVSFRSRSHANVATVAEQFGGGGHKKASGAIIADPLETSREAVIEAVRKELANSVP